VPSVCDRNGWTIDAVLTDNDRSASRHATQDRPQYLELRRLIEAGAVDVVVTWEASRAQRDLRDYLRLRDLCAEQGVLYSYSGRVYDLSRSDDRFNTALDALLAEREADVTRDRVLRGVRANAAAGRPHGRLLYGYGRSYDERGTFLEQFVVEDQAIIIREMARRILAGESCYAIARDLTTRAVPSPGRTTWEPTEVKRILINPAYVGKRVFRGRILGDAAWPAILDEASYRAIVARLTDPRRRTVQDAKLKHLLTGTAVCAECGSPLVTQKNRGHRAYLCRSGFHISVKVESLDGLVTAAIVERLSQADAATVFQPRDNAEAADAVALANGLRARLDQFYTAAAAGEISPGALSRIERELLPKIDDADRRAVRSPVPTALQQLAAGDVASRWAQLPIHLRREVVRLLLCVAVKKDRRGARTFNPGRVIITWRRD
jgi:site-specific DNA recombinase